MSSTEHRSIKTDMSLTPEILEDETYTPLPYVFDLLYDIKYKEQLQEVLELGADNIVSLLKTMNDHQITFDNAPRALEAVTVIRNRKVNDAYNAHGLLKPTEQGACHDRWQKVEDLFNEILQLL